MGNYQKVKCKAIRNPEFLQNMDRLVGDLALLAINFSAYHALDGSRENEKVCATKMRRAQQKIYDKIIEEVDKQFMRVVQDEFAHYEADANYIPGLSYANKESPLFVDILLEDE